MADPAVAASWPYSYLVQTFELVHLHIAWGRRGGTLAPAYDGSVGPHLADKPSRVADGDELPGGLSLRLPQFM